MLSKFKVTSPRYGSFTTRLAHSQIQNHAKPIHLTEIYENEIRRLRVENRFLKMQHNSICYSTEYNLGAASQEMSICKLYFNICI